MKEILLLAVATLPVLVSSCATPRLPQAFHNTDDSALIVKSFDNRTCEVIAPTAIGRVENACVLEQAGAFARHQTAVVILENYSERPLGQEFRDRTFAWFVELRGLGYQHIFFLQRAGVNDPDSLTTLAEYD